MNSSSSSLDPRVPQIQRNIQRIFDILAGLSTNAKDIVFNIPNALLGSTMVQDSDGNYVAKIAQLSNEQIPDQEIDIAKIIGLADQLGMFPMTVTYNEYNDKDSTWEIVSRVISNANAAYTFFTETIPKLSNAAKNIYGFFRGTNNIPGVTRNYAQLNDVLDDTTQIANDASDLAETTTNNLRNTNKKINDVADELGFDPTKEPGDQLTDWNNVLDEIGYDEATGKTLIKKNVQEVVKSAQDATNLANGAASSAAAASGIASGAAAGVSSITNALVGSGGSLAGGIAGALAGFSGGLLGSLFTGGDTNQDGTINPLKGIYADQIKDIQSLNTIQSSQINSLFTYFVDGGFITNNDGKYFESANYPGLFSKILKLINNDSNYATQLNKLGIVNTNLTNGNTSLTTLPNIKIQDLINYLVTSSVLIATTDANNVTTYTPNTNIASGSLPPQLQNTLVTLGFYKATTNGSTTTYSPTPNLFNIIDAIGSLQTSGTGNTRSIFHASVTVGSNYTYGQIGSMAAADHLYFNNMVYSQGTNITLNTSTGRFTLKANKLYKLTGSFNNINSGNNENIAVWWNMTTNTEFGVRQIITQINSTSSRISNGPAVAFIKPNVDTIVELRIWFMNSTNTVFSANDVYGQPWCVIEEAPNNGGGISSLTANNIFIGDANNNPVQVIPSGDVTITNTGVTTLSTTNLLAKTIPSFTPNINPLSANDTLQTFINKTQGQINTLSANSVNGVRSIMHGYAEGYSTNVAINDHIQFNKSIFTQGINISLDGSTPYTTALGVDSKGRIKLKANRTYRLWGIAGYVSVINYIGTRWYDSDNGTYLLGGQASFNQAANYNAQITPGSGALAFITPSTDLRVELRICSSGGSVSSINYDANLGGCYFTVEEVGTNVGVSGLANLTANNILIGDTNGAPKEVIPSGDVTISNTGVTTLDTTALLNKIVPTITPTTNNTAAVSNDNLLTIINKLQGQINLLTANIGIKNIVHGYCSNGATVSVGSRIPFNTNRYTRGSGITLDGNTATLGQIILRSSTVNKTYRLIGSINNATTPVYGATCWYSSTGTVLGLVSGSGNPASSCNRSPSFTIGYIDVSAGSSDVRVELRSTFETITLNAASDAIGPAWFTVEEI